MECISTLSCDMINIKIIKIPSPNLVFPCFVIAKGWGDLWLYFRFQVLEAQVWFWAEMLDNSMSGRWRCHVAGITNYVEG